MDSYVCHTLDWNTKLIWTSKYKVDKITILWSGKELGVLISIDYFVLFFVFIPSSRFPAMVFVRIIENGIVMYLGKLG